MPTSDPAIEISWVVPRLHRLLTVDGGCRRLGSHQVRIPDTATDVPSLSEAAGDQRVAIELIGTPIPPELT
jgi:hypothetical protein